MQVERLLIRRHSTGMETRYSAALTVKEIIPSATLAFTDKVRAHVRSGRETISLGLGEAEVSTPSHIVEAGIKALLDGMTRYSTPQGLRPLRDRIAHNLETAYGVAANAEQIIVTPGAKNALFLACAALLEQGDEVVLLRPCYVSNFPILQIACSNILVREIDLSAPSFDLDREKLSSAITEKTKLMFLNTPNNPTGRMLSADDIDFIASLLRKNRNLYVLSDEVYASMALGDPRHTSLASVADVSDRVITVGGFSKAYFMTGWRIGYVHGNEKITRAMLRVHENINTNTPAFIQFAAIAALDGCQDCVKGYVNKLRERKAIYELHIKRSSCLRGTEFEGGYFALIDISASKMNCDTFAVGLLERKSVAVVPGLAFGRSLSDYCRLSFVNTSELFEEGLIRIQHFMEITANGNSEY
jgi:aspartate/methionine/tyrosine aminotransferase